MWGGGGVMNKMIMELKEMFVEVEANFDNMKLILMCHKKSNSIFISIQILY